MRELDEVRAVRVHPHAGRSQIAQAFFERNAACPYVAGAVEDWDVDDPAGQPLEEVRRIRDELEGRVRELVETRLDEVRADKTAHNIRLAPRTDGRGSACARRRVPR